MFPLTSTEIALNEQVSPEVYHGQKDPDSGAPDRDLYYQLHAREMKNKIKRRSKMASLEELYKLGALQALKDSGYLKKESEKAITVTNEPPKPTQFQRAVKKVINTVKNPAVMP